MSVASPMESTTPVVSRRPTPYTVAISPYRTVSGLMLSMASGADTRMSSEAGAAPTSKFVATTRTCVMPALMATRCPVVASMRASVVSATDQRKLTLGTGADGPPDWWCHAVAKTSASCSVGYTHIATTALIATSVRAARPRPRRMRSSSGGGGVNVINGQGDTQMTYLT